MFRQTRKNAVNFPQMSLNLQTKQGAELSKSQQRITAKMYRISTHLSICHLFVRITPLS